MPSPLPPASNSRRHPVPPLGWLGVTYMGIFLTGLYPVTKFGFPKLLFLIPLTRLPGFGWRIVGGFLLPRSVAEMKAVES